MGATGHVLMDDFQRQSLPWCVNYLLDHMHDRIATLVSKIIREYHIPVEKVMR